MRHSTVSSQVQVPPIVLFRQLQLIDSLLEHFQDFLSLGTTDDFSDLRGQNIESSDCLAVLVLFHVEGFDVFGIVVNDDRAVEDVVAKISFMLRGKINTPVDFVFENDSLLDNLNQSINTWKRISMASE